MRFCKFSEVFRDGLLPEHSELMFTNLCIHNVIVVRKSFVVTWRYKMIFPQNIRLWDKKSWKSREIQKST